MHTGVDIGLKVTSLVTLDDEGGFVCAKRFGYGVPVPEYKENIKTNNVDRFKLYYDDFDSYFVKNNITGTIVFEEPMGTFGGNSIKLAVLKGVYLVSLANHFDSSKVFFPKANEIKLAFTGNGHAKKNDMIRECLKRGHTPAHDHEADAIGMAYMSIEGVL